MREIKFKGKRIDDEGWFYGGFAIVENRPTIFANIECREVVPETVGQYTGLKDKNGKEIYEGDIVSGTALSRERTGVIVWIGQLAGFGIRYTERDDSTAWQESSILKDIEKHKYSEFCAEVIGNIHDNPELLERGKEE